MPPLPWRHRRRPVGPPMGANGCSRWTSQRSRRSPWRRRRPRAGPPARRPAPHRRPIRRPRCRRRRRRGQRPHMLLSVNGGAMVIQPSGIVSVHPLQVAEVALNASSRLLGLPSSPLRRSTPPPRRPPVRLPHCRCSHLCDQSHQCHLQVFLLSHHLCHLGWDNPTRLRFQSHSPRQQRKSDRFLAWQQHRRQAVRATMRTSPW